MVRLGMQIAFGQVRRKTAPTKTAEKIVLRLKYLIFIKPRQQEDRDCGYEVGFHYFLENIEVSIKFSGAFGTSMFTC